MEEEAGRYGLALLPADARRVDKQRRFEALLARGFGQRILPVDRAAAEATADIMAHRRHAGAALDHHVRDALIAGIARSGGHSIATRNSRQYAGAGVDLIDPWQRG